MIQFVLFLLIAALLLCGLYFLARRRPHLESGTEALLEARSAIETLRAGLLPPEVVRRIVAEEDRSYVLSEAPEELQTFFFEERKRLALLWVEQVRRQIASLSQFHRHSARFYEQLEPAMEIRLAAEFAGLLFACRVVQCLVYVAGPYSIPNVIESTATAASRMCAHSEKSLGFLSPLQQGSVL